jgi:hypothetical protein
MANKTYMTSDDLLASVKRRGNIPDTQDLISNNEILEFANEEMLLNLIPLVYSKHEDYYLVRQEIPLQSGVTRYPIPYRSIGAKVREIAYKRTDGSLAEMFRISVDDITSRSESYDSLASHYYFEGEEIVLFVDPNFQAVGSLVVFYHLRPNALVLSERVGIITNIIADMNPLYKQIYLNTLPANFEEGLEFDFIKTKSPHRVVEYDKIIKGVNSTSNYILVNASDIPSSIVVGDRIALAGETDIVNAPSDMHVLLAQYTIERVLESLGDTEGLRNANAKSMKMEQNSNLLLANRAIGSPTKVRVRNGTIGNASSRNRRRRF